MSILKIWITNYNSTDPTTISYKIGLVSSAGASIPSGDAFVVNAPGNGAPGYEIALPTADSNRPRDAVALMDTGSGGTAGQGSTGGVAPGYQFNLDNTTTANSSITGIVIDVKNKIGDDGSGDFVIYHSTATQTGNDLYSQRYMTFSYQAMTVAQTQETGGDSYVYISGVNTLNPSISAKYNGASLIRDANGNITGFTGGTINDAVKSTATITGGEYQSNSLAQKFVIYYENGDGADLILATSITNCLASITEIPKIVPVNTLNVGDIVRTNVGDQKISKIMKSNNLSGKREYVIFEKNCFNNNLPTKDIFLTSFHPLSIGYFNVKDINNGKEDPQQDEKVFVHIGAISLVGKLPGIYKKTINDEAEFNLIFDKHCSIDIGGLDVVTHHPVGNDVFPNPRLAENEFQNPETATKKKDKPFYITYERLLNYKPKDMDLKEFLGKCLVYDINKKFNFGTIDANDNSLKDKFNYD